MLILGPAVRRPRRMIREIELNSYHNINNNSNNNYNNSNNKKININSNETDASGNINKFQFTYI